MSQQDAGSMSLRGVGCTRTAVLCAPSLARAAPGESRFARPVATITWAATALTRRIAQILSPRASPVAPRIRQDIEVRAVEECLARAADHADLGRLERAFEHREPEGMRTWDWR